MVRILQKVIFVVFGLIVGLLALSSQQTSMSPEAHEYLTSSGQGLVSAGFHEIMLGFLSKR